MADILDSLGKIFETGGWIDKNKGWLQPALTFATGAYGAASQGNARGDVNDILRQAEQQNYDNQKANYNAWANYATNAASANAAAARRTEANRQAAARRAMSTEKKFYNQSQAMFAPYVETGKALLPRQAQAYSSGLSLYDKLLSQMLANGTLGQANQSTPAYATGIKLPDYLRGA